MPKPMEKLNEDCWEKIFLMLELKDLVNAEKTCEAWKEVIRNKRIYRRLASRIFSFKLNLSSNYNYSDYNDHAKILRSSKFIK